LGPRSANIEPCGTSRLTPFNACLPDAYVLTNERMETAGGELIATRIEDSGALARLGRQTHRRYIRPNGELTMTARMQDTRYVETTRIACDGDEGALGHPRVFLQMDATGVTECPYCDRLFILAGGPADPQTASVQAEIA
jgi:uncharacterized Zn-finger protein